MWVFSGLGWREGGEEGSRSLDPPRRSATVYYLPRNAMSCQVAKWLECNN